jgi:hypothetical protein
MRFSVAPKVRAQINSKLPPPALVWRNGKTWMPRSSCDAHLDSLALYFLPAIVAGMRGHHNSGSIFVLNLFLGWTFLGWIVALAMACSQVRRIETVAHPIIIQQAEPVPATAPMIETTNARFCPSCGAGRRRCDILLAMRRPLFLKDLLSRQTKQKKK